MKQKTKKFWKWTGIIVFCLFIFVFVFNNVVSLINYNINKQFDGDITNVINNQNIYDEVKLGLGNVANNGCGPVAIYNILHLENKRKNLSTIIKELDVYGLNVFGLLGTNPFVVKQYLANCGFKTNIYFKVSEFDEHAKTCKYAIFTYITLHYGHYQLMYDYNEVANTFKFINPTFTNTFEYEMGTIDENAVFCLITVH